MLCLLMMSVRGEVYIEYRMGPSTEPGGTPQMRLGNPNPNPNLTNWLLSHREDCIQPKAFPVIPKRCFSLVMRISWSTVSNAPERSSNTINTNVGRFANESFRKPSVRKRVGSIRKRPIVVSQTSKGRFTWYDFVACDKLTTGLRHDLRLSALTSVC